MDQALRSLGETMGFTGKALEAFVYGREGRPMRDGFDGLLDFARDTLGMDEASAKLYAIGRDGGSEYEAREAWDGPAASDASDAARRLPDVIESAVTALWHRQRGTLGAARQRVSELVARERSGGAMHVVEFLEDFADQQHRARATGGGR